MSSASRIQDLACRIDYVDVGQSTLVDRGGTRDDVGWVLCTPKTLFLLSKPWTMYSEYLRGIRHKQQRIYGRSRLLIDHNVAQHHLRTILLMCRSHPQERRRHSRHTQASTLCNQLTVFPTRWHVLPGLNSSLTRQLQIRLPRDQRPHAGDKFEVPMLNRALRLTQTTAAAFTLCNSGHLGSCVESFTGEHESLRIDYQMPQEANKWVQACLTLWASIHDCPRMMSGFNEWISRAGSEETLLRCTRSTHYCCCGFTND